mgnify:FL=1
MKLTENHAYEQFFFSEETTDRLVSLALPFQKPLLLCTPSLAVALAEKKRKFILLDRDRRFKKLRGYEQFDLRNPHMVFAKFDAIFADPPFSNISLEDFHRTVELLAQGAPRRPPLYLCYINTREPALLLSLIHI